MEIIYGYKTHTIKNKFTQQSTAHYQELHFPQLDDVWLLHVVKLSGSTGELGRSINSRKLQSKRFNLCHILLRLPPEIFTSELLLCPLIKLQHAPTDCLTH